MTYQRTPGVYSPPLDLTTGELVPPRAQIGSVSTTYASQGMPLAYFTADKTETISTLTTYTAGTAAAATPTLCRMGIYSIAANGDGTLIASTPNDTALFAATFTAYPKALSVAFVKQQGQRYATAVLVVSAAAMPFYIGPPFANAQVAANLMILPPVLGGRILAQTDLPSSFVAGSVVATNGSGRVAMLLS